MLRRGFTLIELLVVIAIIGILGSIVLASLSSARSNAQLVAGRAQDKALFDGYGTDAIGVWRLNTGSGTTILNIGSNGGADGTITGATWSVGAGPDGKAALTFAAAGSKVALGSITLPQNVTVAGWIQTSSGGQQPAFSNRGSGLYFGTTGGKFFAYYNNSSVSGMTSIASVNDNKWHFLVWSSDGTTEKMYVDGRFDSQMAQIRPGGDVANANIGFDTPNNETFSGNIALLAIYPTVLASAEIKTLYAQGLFRFLAKK